MLLNFIYAVSLATLGISIPRHVSGNAVDFGPDFDLAPAKRTDAGTIQPDGSVLCPGQAQGDYCDCSGDCTDEPSWCSCPNAVSCCNQASVTDNDVPPYMEEFYPHNAAIGTQHGREDDDPLYWTGNADIPSLPVLTGYMGTHGVYRHFMVMEQTAVMIGEAKHGLWRIHEAGFIREYLRTDAGTNCWLENMTNPNEWSTDAEYDILMNQYSHYSPDVAYHYPDDEVDENGCLNFVDLTIYHDKYNDTLYEEHAPLDMPMMYCTMTQGNYVHTKQAWNYAKAQPLANQIGPLGIRAGLDINHLYLNVIRFDLFSDASLWVNVGDTMKTTLTDLQDTVEQKVDYQRANPDEMDMEFYLVERPFFNTPYLFIIAIIENKYGDSDFSYIRPDGYYYNELMSRESTWNSTGDVFFGTDENSGFYPKVSAEIYDTDTDTTTYENKTVQAIPVYAASNPSRISFGHTGGACPTKGGDYSTYPFGNPGAGWPTQYEEVGPLCDGYLLDVKVWANLGTAESWTDRQYLLANAGKDNGQNMSMGYHVHANIYGVFTDDYLVDNGITNPRELDLNNGVQVDTTDADKPTVDFALNYTRTGYHSEVINPPEEDMEIEYTLVQADQTLRPISTPENCASFASGQRQLYWRDCETAQADANIVTEFEFVADTSGNYGYMSTICPVDDPSCTKYCWTIKRTSKAFRQKVYVGRCKYNQKQRWVMEHGQVWFYEQFDFRHDPKTRYCAAYGGEDTKISTRECFRELAEYSENGRYENDDDDHDN